VHRDSILIRSNKKQQYAVIYLLQIYSTCNVVALLRDMTCTRGCSYSFMYSWWWVRWTAETCRV